jgi:co-chaperonin GroES (HSP10)
MIIPRNDRVLLQRMPDPPSGHIVLTDVQTLRWARVVAIGPKVYDLNIGDVVLLPGIAADVPDFQDVDHILVQLGDIGCKLS